MIVGVSCLCVPRRCQAFGAFSVQHTRNTGWQLRYAWCVLHVIAMHDFGCPIVTCMRRSQTTEINSDARGLRAVVSQPRQQPNKPVRSVITTHIKLRLCVAFSMGIAESFACLCMLIDHAHENSPGAHNLGSYTQLHLRHATY